MRSKDLKTKEIQRQCFLEKVRTVFEKKYGRKLLDEEVEQIASSITSFACLSHNVYSKQLGKKPIYRI